MPILSAAIVYLVTSSAFATKLPWQECDFLLQAHPHLQGHAAFEPTDVFMLDFRPWRTEAGELVGRRDGVTWRIDLEKQRMSYEFTPARPGKLGLMTAARTVVRVALSAREGTERGLDGADLRDYRATFTPDARVRVEMPVDKRGVDFVIGLHNRLNTETPFKPISAYRRVQKIIPVAAAAVAPEPAAPPRPWYHRLKFWTWFAKKPVAAPAGPSYTAEYVDERRFDEGTIKSVRSWADRQFSPAWSLNPLAGHMIFELPSPGGVMDLVAHGRRVVDLALEFARAGRALDGLRLAVAPNNGVRVTVPYTQAGLDFVEALEARATDYASAPLERDLSRAEGEFVRALLKGIADVMPLAEIKVDHFVKPIPKPGPTAAELEAARFAVGPALPDAMIQDSRTLRRAQIYYGAYGPWTARGDQWLAHAFGVDVTVQTSGALRFVRFDLGVASPEAAERARWAFVRTAGLKSGNADVKIRAPIDSAGNAHLVIETPLSFVGTAVLADLRDRATIDAQLTEAERRFADEWIEGSVGPLTELFPLRDAAE